MSVNTGPIICSTLAAITHNQKVNRNNEEKVNSTSERNKIMTNYQPITSSKEILEELRSILEQEKYKDEDSISVYDVINLIRKKHEECQSLNRHLRRSIKSLTGLNSLFLDVDFDCENRQLIINYDCNKMFFTKQNDDLIIVKSEYYNAKDILGKCGKEISERYDKFIEDISFYRDYINNIKSMNSSFIINSDKYTVNIKYNNFFELSAIIYKNEYEYDCNSNNVTTICRDKEDEIFKRIFIKIDDCPEWTREILYRIRNEQLEEQSKIEYKKIKKQKRLELVRRLNPFRKKISHN